MREQIARERRSAIRILCNGGSYPQTLVDLAWTFIRQHGAK
jgi:hypothetical protein